MAGPDYSQTCLNAAVTVWDADLETQARSRGFRSFDEWFAHELSDEAHLGS